MHYVLICGSRDWTLSVPIIRELRSLPEDTTIIHGDCRGADKLAGYFAERLGLKVQAYPAEWDRHGKSAGHIRNRQMLYDNPELELVLAFSEHIASSKGTSDMVRQALKQGIEVRIITK
jgi:hypothetical protein